MKKRDNSMKMTAISGLFGVVLCAAMFSVTSYAFFTDSVTSIQSKVESADYVLTADMPTATKTELGNGRVSFLLSAGTHTVTVTATGTATVGFGIFTVNGDTYYTDEVYTANATNQLSFDFVCQDITTVVFDYQWGSNVDSGRTIVLDGATVNI